MNIPLHKFHFEKINLFFTSLSNRQLLWVDALIFLMAPIIAIFLRIETIKDLQRWDHWGLWVAMLCFGAVKFGILKFSGFYKRYWRFAGTDELMMIAGLALSAAILNIIGIKVLYTLLPLPPLPRSLPILDSIISFIAIGVARFSIRYTELAHQRSQTNEPSERLLIVGAGSAGVALAEDMMRHPHLGFQPIAFIDDDLLKKGLKVRGIPIIGDRFEIPTHVRQLNIHRVIIAMPSAAGVVIRQIVDICQQQQIKTSTLPGLSEILSGQVKVASVRPLKIEDLLRRDPIETDIQRVMQLLSGKRVLVTGAGGSIGSELCRQILKCNPSEIILLGHGENSIFYIHQELQQILRDSMGDQGPQLHPMIADMRDQVRIEFIFKQLKPEIVFHAAAHKHVPMMEHNPAEAVTNNIQGTQVLLQNAIQFGVQHFVMISSDKAVQPTSVMGASKRVAEHLVLHTATQSGCCFSVVRFGNVLGSRGSVVPTFQHQIESGGPITITHPSICRYFMTIPEAVQLVLQASVFSKGGEVFMLNMGEPIKIVDLAKDLIHLSGYELGRDIDIVYTGLRPGEKLFEELLIPGEEYEPTSHAKLLAVRNASQMIPEELSDSLNQLCDAAQKNDKPLIQALLKQLVNSYIPSTINIKSIKTDDMPASA
jgi:FlaA1/EpsC-like NDP-sugar epimerase